MLMAEPAPSNEPFVAVAEGEAWAVYLAQPERAIALATDVINSANDVAPEQLAWSYLSRALARCRAMAVTPDRAAMLELTSPANLPTNGACGAARRCARRRSISYDRRERRSR